MDICQSFIFQDIAIRGIWLQLNQTINTAALKSRAPDEQRLLSQAMAGIILLGAVKQKDGRTLLQFRGEEGANLKLLSAQVTHSGYVRATLQRNHPQSRRPLNLTDGQLAVIYQPDKVTDQHQSIVTSVNNDLIASLENYFFQSEQIPTKINIYSHNGQLIALLLQSLPDKDKNRQKGAFEYAGNLTHLITDQAAFSMPFTQYLQKLYARNSLQFFTEKALKYGCEGAQRRIQNAILSLGKAQALKILETKHSIDVTCDFCCKTCNFDHEAIQAIFNKGEITC